MTRITTLILALVFATACAKRPNTTSASEAHPAINVANQVLAAIHASDAAAIRPLFNATNQRKVSDSDLEGLFRESKDILGDVHQVSELREHYRDGFVAAKIRVVGGEVFVVVLSLEDGKYLFEDLNSPGVDDWEKLGQIWP